MKMANQKEILKISSLKLRQNNWDLHITIEDAKKNEELVALGDSQTLRFIKSIRGYDWTERDITEKKREIKTLKRLGNTEAVRKKMAKTYEELNKMVFIEDYISVVFESKKDFDYACTKGFYINGKKFKRLVGTTGGVKNSTVQFCNEEIYEELNKRLENGWNKKTPLIPAKFEAYKALACSVSTPVTMPRMIIIKDGTVQIKDKVIRVSDDGNGGFNVEYNVDYTADKDFCDGCGMVSPEFSAQIAIDLDQYHLDEDGNKVADYIPSGYNTRFSYSKGMICTFPFVEFAEEVAGEYMVEDAWGDMRDIREADIILTTNMVKLWSAYENMEDYLSNCKENGYDFCITKITPRELEKKRNMNYQYLQSYEDMSDEDIEKLVSESVENIKGALGDDYRKAIMFTRGTNSNESNVLNSEPDFIKALMIDQSVSQDSYVKQQIYKMIHKKINDAKMGVLQVDGNYAIVCGDLYALCQSMFKMPITGLLKYGEFYNGHWVKQGVKEVVAFRSPMTSRFNIRKFKYIDNPMVRKWFRYLDQIQVLNAWDTTCDAMNGMDYDSDAIITSNNEVLLRNTKEEPAIICEQQSVPKTKVTEGLLRKANKNGFGDAIGTYTNRITTMFDIMAQFDKNSEEYKELEKRTICGQGYQQEAIDKIKGINAKTMPKEWYDYKANKVAVDAETGEILDDEETVKRKEINLKLMVNKKPYFFIYNYAKLKSEYNSLKKETNKVSIVTYGKSYEDLVKFEDKTKEEQDFIRYAELSSPVFDNPCVMNRICHKLENVFEDVKASVKDNSKFDYSVYKTKKRYKSDLEKEVAKIVKSYKNELANVRKRFINDNVDVNSVKRSLKQQIIQELAEVCPSEEILTNIILDITYGKKVNKDIAWDLCGEQIIRNLLAKNDNKITFFAHDEDGEFVWNGEKFKEVDIYVEVE